MTTNIINGKKVEYLHIHQNLDGSIEVTYSEKFNLAIAHMSDIMKRLRSVGVECQVFKILDKDIVVIQLYHIEDLHGALHSLCIPHNAYEFNETDLSIIVDVPLL